MTHFVAVDLGSADAMARWQSIDEIFLNHPHFMMFPGDSIEVMECLPIPRL